jgi:hypothetical protein
VSQVSKPDTHGGYKNGRTGYGRKSVSLDPFLWLVPIDRGKNRFEPFRPVFGDRSSSDLGSVSTTDRKVC